MALDGKTKDPGDDNKSLCWSPCEFRRSDQSKIVSLAHSLSRSRGGLEVRSRPSIHS